MYHIKLKYIFNELGVSNSSSEASGMSSSSSTCGNSSNKTPHENCASRCLGAIPRNPNFKKGGHHYPKVVTLINKKNISLKLHKNLIFR